MLHRAAIAFSLLTTVASAAVSHLAIDGDHGTFGISVQRNATDLRIGWLIGGPTNERGWMSFSLDTDRPLIEGVGIDDHTILRDVNPAGVVTVGTRDLKPAGWIVFFDKVPTRPFEAFPLTLNRDAIHVVEENNRTSVVIDGATAGPFTGTMKFTFYPGSRLVRAAMVMATDRPATAYLFDAGLTVASVAPVASVASGGKAKPVPWKSIAYTDLTDQLVRVATDALPSSAKSPQVRSRTIMAEGIDYGSLAIVPPPHQYFYPLDYANNYATVWLGHDYRALRNTVGFGVRQTVEGDKRWVPWVNAPPATKQDMGIFYLLGDGDAAQTSGDVLAYTRNDSYKPLPGHMTFSSHYHVEHTVDLLNQQKKAGNTEIPADLVEPQFVKRFKALGVNIIHLAEFHLGDGDMKVADRLTRLKTLHAECARLSTDKFLLLPGEEPNVHLGGHWLSFFPKPVYWTLDRRAGQPFVEDDATLGKVYHVGSSDDVLDLMRAENGLMWAAHPRIKASTGFPDVYKNSDFFKSDRYLGGAWKAMPADYSLPRLGTRVLDLLDDMNNWAADPSERKQAPGEVDIFAIDADSELYAHMNVNYLSLDALPKFADGWQPVLDALRGGHFFTTTGEVLIDSFSIDDKMSGQVLHNLTGESTVVANLEWTFPLAYAQIVSGDGEHVFRQHIDLSDTMAFGTYQLKANVDLRGKRWARFEVWDVATNGAYSQPIWIEP